MMTVVTIMRASAGLTLRGAYANTKWAALLPPVPSPPLPFSPPSP